MRRDTDGSRFSAAPSYHGAVMLPHVLNGFRTIFIALIIAVCLFYFFPGIFRLRMAY
jgi:hypothetical protein